MSSFDAEKFCIDHSVPYWTEGKNVTAGWVNIQCPFCGDHSNHGGFNLDEGYYNCWKCGWHALDEVIKEVTDEPWFRVYQILDEYSHPIIAVKTKVVRPEQVVLPPETGALRERHRQYLIRRGFDPDELEKEYDLRGTGHIGRYAFRIIIPIYYNGQLVSYEGRDITGMQDQRYKACALSDEVVPRKNILYNIDHVPGRVAVVCEGVTDVWRMGRGAVATFGISYTQAQVNLILKRFERVVILYDMGDDAQIQADRLAWQISAGGRESIIYELDGVDDPASMSDQDARKLMKEILG